MRRLLFVLTALSATFAYAQDTAVLAAKADALLNSYANAGRLQGSALVAKDGKIILAKGYGLANIELDVANKPETKFRLGSITKQFTATLILQLQEQGKLNVNDPISKYIPNSPETWKDITIHHLLTHTSGIPTYTSGDYVKHMRENTPPLEFIKRFRDLPLEFQPGSQFKYDNSGYFLLGVIVEQVTGKKYEDVLRQNIFDRLDMADSGYDWAATILRNRATGYSKDQDKVINADYQDMSQPYAAGSLYSTVLDMYKWDRALYTDKILSAKSREAAFTQQKQNYGYGWMIGRQHGHKIVEHGGGISGFATSIRRAVEEDAVAIVLTNTDRGGNPGKIATDLLGVVLGEDVKLFEERKEVTVDAKSLERFTGKYQLAGATFTVALTADGRLTISPGGQSPLVLHPYAPDSFFLKEADLEFRFPSADEIVMKQGRGETKGKRIAN